MLSNSGLGNAAKRFKKIFVRFSVFFFDFGQAAVFVGIFKGGLQEMAVFGEGLGEIGRGHKIGLITTEKTRL